LRPPQSQDLIAQPPLQRSAEGDHQAGVSAGPAPGLVPAVPTEGQPEFLGVVGFGPVGRPPGPGDASLGRLGVGQGGEKVCGASHEKLLIPCRHPSL
jgi:hypothetical protein